MVFWLQWQRQWMAFTSYPQIFTNRSQEILHFPCPIHFGQHEASGWHWQRLSGSREPTALRTLAESYFNLAGQETSAPPAVMKFLFLPRLHLAASVIGSPLFSAHCQEGGGGTQEWMTQCHRHCWLGTLCFQMTCVCNRMSGANYHELGKRSCNS